jgi:WD repeat-containing protein 35
MLNLPKMHAYLTKKIVIPNNVGLKCISWNKEQGWIASGGQNGLLKVLKLDTSSSTSDIKGIAGTLNLTMNQTLAGHSGEVSCVAWNPRFRKLTTCDDNGLIIVWVLHKNMWYEEMVNNRNISMVKDMKWSFDGTKICIVYSDGAIIVGSVDGDRLWGKQLDNNFKIVEWSPDNGIISIASLSNEIILVDNTGNHLKTVVINSIVTEVTYIVKIHWKSCKGSDIKSCCLQIAFDTGSIVQWDGANDQSNYILQSQIRSSSCCWNKRGDVIAVYGQDNQILSTKKPSTSKVINAIHFYSDSGELISTLKVPGKAIADLSWEKSGLRMSIAVDSCIYFVDVRPSYKFAYLGNTVMYTSR